MLAMELAGTEFSKTAHRARLLKKLNGRSRGSVEFKHQNISAVLNEQGLPYITGYKPRENYQKSLGAAVLTFLAAHPEVLEGIQAKLVEPPKKAVDASKFRIEDIEEAPPVPSPKKTKKNAAGRLVDWTKVNAAQDRLGKLGEEFVLELERRYLVERGRSDLASKVKRVSMDEGDGLGYDIRSFQTDGELKYIEVKTTNGNKATPFFLTANELLVSDDLAGDYSLYRVFKFSSGEPGLYRLSGPLSKELDLEPTLYRARYSG